MEQGADGPVGSAAGGFVASWEDVRGEILRGITHDLNNRVLALMGVRELAEEGLDASLLQLFGDEVVRLERTAGLLRRLAEEPAGEEVVEAAPLLATVRDLHARHAGLRQRAVAWVVADHLPALRSDPVRAARVLLRVLATSGRAAAEEGGEEGPRVRAGEEAGRLVVEARPWPAGARVEEDEPVEASVSDGGLRLRFPSA